MKRIATFSRILVGIVFIFSSFVKGVDPLGTAYKIEDYFIAYGWEWAMPFALFLAISLCALEFILGVAALLNLRMKFMAWPLLFLMSYFTVLTYFDAIYEPVPDCGCFGDAIKLTNWETFYKNVFLILLVIIIFWNRKKYSSFLSSGIQNTLIILFIAGFTLFSVYQYRHLPLIDFRGWKIGAELVPDNRGEAKIYLKYQSKATGETMEYLSPNYPWNDSAWLAEWEFVDQRIDDSGVIKGHSLMISDAEGNDVTSYFIENPGYQFLLVSWNLNEAPLAAFQDASKLSAELIDAGHSFIVLTGSLMDDVEEFSQAYNPDLEYFNADDIELKTMIRANPGLILIKDGIVLDKWHWRDFPTYEDLRSEYPDI